MLLPLAAEAVHHSKAAFYLGGGALAVWAIVLSALGLSKPGFPSGRRGERLVLLVSVLLVTTAMATAVITA